MSFPQDNILRPQLNESFQQNNILGPQYNSSFTQDNISRPQFNKSLPQNNILRPQDMWPQDKKKRSENVTSMSPYNTYQLFIDN